MAYPPNTAAAVNYSLFAKYKTTVSLNSILFPAFLIAVLIPS
jgi:hypothetical protein